MSKKKNLEPCQTAGRNPPFKQSGNYKVAALMELQHEFPPTWDNPAFLWIVWKRRFVPASKNMAICGSYVKGLGYWLWDFQFRIWFPLYENFSCGTNLAYLTTLHMENRPWGTVGLDKEYPTSIYRQNSAFALNMNVYNAFCVMHLEDLYIMYMHERIRTY